MRLSTSLVLVLWLVVGLGTPASRADFVVDFNDLNLPPNSFYNGSDSAGGFTSNGVFFNNNYNPTFGNWSGWSYSNVNDTTTPGFGNQYAAIPGTGFAGAGIYGVAYNFSQGNARVSLPAGVFPESVAITNTTYAFLSMRDGDSFSRRFGGTTGDTPDFFQLRILGLNSANVVTGVVDFLLADFRFSDNTLDYIVDEWTTVDLSGLGQAQSLEFVLTSSDNGPFGMNTPAYFAIDQLTTVPEPSSWVLVVVALAGAAVARRWQHRRSMSGV